MRFPLDALVEAAGCRSDLELARRIGMSGASLKDARRLGLNERAADRHAIRCGLHPVSVWPEYEFIPVRECVMCGEPFVPAQVRQAYCSKRCRWRQTRRVVEQRPVVTHGRVASYRAGCKCEACTEANRLRMRRYRANRRAA